MAYSRRLPFFDQTTVHESHKDLFRSLTNSEPVCYTAGRGYLWVGTCDGTILRFDRLLQMVSFQAHTFGLRHLFQLESHDILISIGSDDNGEEQLKVWNTSKWGSKPTPLCIRCTNVCLAGQPNSSVTCLCAHDNLQLIVLGHADGQLQLLKGDLTRERACKRQLLHTFSTAVTGAGIDLRCTRNAQTSDNNAVVVFANSEQCIMSFVVGKRDDSVSKVVLDRFGTGFHCSTLIRSPTDGSQYAVARSDAVYFYNWDGRGPCLATDGNKLAMCVFKQYLVITKGQSVPGQGPHSLPNSVTVTIHDQQNKFIAGEFHISGFESMFVEWDGIHLVCSDLDSEGCFVRKLISLSEKCTQAKLDMLFSKKNFQFAIDIANSQRMSKEQLAQIHWRYADHLYKQKEYDASVIEYIKTIGTLEGSSVIQRFIEGGHITQLTRYLESLSDVGLASGDHLILLLNCYARLQDRTRLEKFVKGAVNPKLNVASALQMLRQFNFPQIALQLARTSGRHADQVCILIEDLDDTRGALESMEKFPFNDALKAICTYGYLLIDQLPSETLHLLGKLCSHPDASCINVHHFLKIFINNPSGLMQFLERYVSTSHESIKVAGIVDALLEIALYELNKLQSDSISTDTLSSNHSRDQLRNLIMKVLRDDKLLYDERKALLLCHKRQFFEACIFLWEKLKLYDQLLKHYMEKNNPAQVLEVCQRFGQEMPKLWLIALRYFASRPDCPDALQKVIAEIDQQNLASPMTVLEILSDTDREHSCQIGTIRDYLLRHLEAEAKHVASLQQEVQELRCETSRNRAVVRNLNTEIKVFQQQKCSICHQTLEPPSVHFLCDHSYHAMCFENYAGGDQLCPECAPKNRKLLSETAKVTSLGNHGLKPEQVFEQLRTALHPDGFTSDSNSSTLAKHIAGSFIMEAATDLHSQGSVASSNPVNTEDLQKEIPSVAIQSRHSSFGNIPQPDAYVDSNPFCIPPINTTPLTAEQSKSTSTGYHSGDQRDPNPFDTEKSHPRNPFEEPDLIEDPGLGPSLQSLNPFDSE